MLRRRRKPIERLFQRDRDHKTGRAAAKISARRPEWPPIDVSELKNMPTIMPRTPNAREALEWIQKRLESGHSVTVQQPGIGMPVEWSPQRWAHFVDDLHIPPLRTRQGELLMCIAIEGWDGNPEYVTVDTLEMVVYAILLTC